MKVFPKDRFLSGVSLMVFLVVLFSSVFYGWLVFVHVSTWDDKVAVEERALTQLQQERDALMTDELREFLQRYTQTVSDLEAVLALRDEVFTGDLSPDHFAPLMVLDIVQFLAQFRAHLSPEVVVNTLSLSPEGELTFLVQSTSYQHAAEQMRAFSHPVLDEHFPGLFQSVSVSSVSRTALSLTDQEKLPALLQGRDASFDFFVKLQIDPAFYFAHADALESSLSETSYE